MHSKFYQTIKAFLSKVLKRNDICAVRVGKGCAKSPPLTCYDGATTMYWYLGQSLTQNIWSDSASEPGQVDWVELDSDNWTKIRFVQALYSNSAIDESPSKVEQTSSSPEIQNDIPNP